MMHKDFFKNFSDSYVFVLGASLFFGLAFSSYTMFLAPLSTWLLAIIFFLTALKVDLREIFRYLDDVRTVLLSTVFMLLLLPAIIYYGTLAVYPSLAVAFLILAAMPSGMTAPLLAEISGGKQSLALVLTVATSLIAPFSVPLVIKAFAGTAVSVSFFAMFTALAQVIFIPFILANILKRLRYNDIQKASFVFSPLSIILLGLLITGIVAKRAESIISGLAGGETLVYIAAVFLLFLLLHTLGYFMIFWKHKSERITITVCLTYMNFTLAIFLVDKFFPESNIALPVIFSVLPWAIMSAPYTYLSKRFLANAA